MKVSVKNKKEIGLNATVKVKLPGQRLHLRRMVSVGFYFQIFFSQIIWIYRNLTKSFYCGQIKLSVLIVDSDRRKNKE